MIISEISDKRFPFLRIKNGFEQTVYGQSCENNKLNELQSHSVGNRFLESWSTQCVCMCRNFNEIVITRMNMLPLLYDVAWWVKEANVKEEY